MLEEKQENVLQRLDDFEEEIELINVLNKRYDDLKKDLKSTMLEYANNSGANQIKWITPKGISITCSVGHNAEYEEKEIETFDLEKLKNEYPEIYEKCIVKKVTKSIVKNASNDTLRITMPKEK